MKKSFIVILCVMMLCLSSSVFGVNLIDSSPIDGSTQYNNVIDFWLQGNESISAAYVWIDNGAWTQYSMICALNECNLTQDVSGWEDYRNYSFYYSADGVNRPLFPNTYLFFLDRPPSQVTGVNLAGVSDSEIEVSWIANSENDIVTYNVYASQTSPVVVNSTNLIGSTSGLTFTHSGLLTGQTWFYVVTAEDNNVEGLPSIEKNETVQDFSPPVVPIINPSSGSTVNTTSPTITIDYTAGSDSVVFVNITSGAVDIASFSGNNTYVWTPILTAGVVYDYNIKSCDEYNNCRDDEYTIMAEKNLSFNSTVVVPRYVDYSDMTQLISQTTGDGNGYWLYQVNLESYGAVEDSFRPFILDYTGITDIFIPENSQPIAFCGADLIGNDVSVTPTYNIYDMDNVPDLTQSGLNCPQEGLTSVYKTRIIFRVPVPLGTLPGIYSSGYAFSWDWI